MRKIFCAFLVGFLVMPLAARESPQVDVLNLRSKGMGGVQLGIVDDQYSIMHNPAGPAILRLERDGKRWLSIIKAAGVISGDLLSIWDHKEDFESIASGSTEINNDTWNYLVHLKVSAAISPAYVSLINILPFNLNLAIFDSLNVKMQANPDIPVPTWDITAFNDTAAVLNLGLPLLDFKRHQYLYAGVNAKLIHRVIFTEERTDLFYLYNFTAISLEEMDVVKALGLGFDAGLIWAAGREREFKMTFTATDIGGTRFAWSKFDQDDLLASGAPAGVSYIETALHFGMSYKLGTVIPVLMYDVLLAIDYRNILKTDVNPFLRLYMGFEFKMLGFIDVRGGLYQGWLSGGVGLDVPILPLEINFAYWSEELGDNPGDNRVDHLGASVNLVF